jgi:hypothetical protein
MTVTVSPRDELQLGSTHSDPLGYVIFQEHLRNIVTYSDIFAGARLLEVGTNHKA